MKAVFRGFLEALFLTVWWIVLIIPISVFGLIMIMINIIKDVISMNNSEEEKAIIKKAFNQIIENNVAMLRMIRYGADDEKANKYLDDNL